MIHRDHVAVKYLDQVVSPVIRSDVEEWSVSNYDVNYIPNYLEPLFSTPSGLNLDKLNRDFWTESYYEAVDAMHLEDEYKCIPIYDVNLPPSSYAGFNYYCTRGEAIPFSIRRAERALANYEVTGHRVDLYTPYTALMRTQLSRRTESKIRLVFGAADHNLRIESTVMDPIYKGWYKRRLNPTNRIAYGWGLQELERFLVNGNNWLHADYKHVNPLDWKHWDLSLEPEEISSAFAPLYSRFDKPLQVEFTEDYFVHKSLAIPAPDVGRNTGRVVHVRGYGPSGSKATVYVNNFGNQRRSRYVAKCLGLKQFDCFTAQDDMLWLALNFDDMTPDRIETVLRPWHLAELKFDPTAVSSGIQTSEFLHNTTRYGHLIRDFKELYLHAIYPERYDNYDPALAAGRLRGIFFAGNQMHSEFLIAARMIEHDYKLGIQDAHFDSRATPAHINRV